MQVSTAQLLDCRGGNMVAAPPAHSPPQPTDVPVTARRSPSQPVVAAVERLLQVLEYVLDALEPHREAHQPVLQPARKAIGPRDHGVRHRRLEEGQPRCSGGAAEVQRRCSGGAAEA